MKGLWPAHSCHSRPQLLSQLPLRNEVLNLLKLESYAATPPPPMQTDVVGVRRGGWIHST